MNTTLYRTQFAAYNSSLALAHYQQHLDSEPELRIDRLRADYGDLFSNDALADLQSALAGIRPEAESEAAGVRALLGAARLEHLEIQVDEATRELATCESRTRIRWSGEAVSPQTISFHLATEPDKTRRAELGKRWVDAVASCNDLRVSRLRLLHQASASLSFDSYTDLIAESTRTNLQQVRLDSEGLLEQTESVYRSAVSRVVKHDSSLVTTSELGFADLVFLERMPWLDKFFATQNWMKIYSEMFDLLGIRVDRQPNIQISVLSPALRDRQSACFAVNPPGDVRLVFSARPGAAGFDRSLYTAGVGQQHAWCSKTLADKHPEFIFSADPATTEAYGWLFSFLLLDPKWTQQFLAPISEAQARELAADVTAVLALRIRRLIAESSYAMLLHAAGQPSLEQLQSAFVDLQNRATAFHFSPELFLLNLHERFSSAAHLRALVFAAGLREYLRRRYGNRWWVSRKAGDELIDLWNTASRYPVEELARLIGFEFNFELLAELLNSILTGAMK